LFITGAPIVNSLRGGIECLIERPGIEKILIPVGLDPLRPPKGRVRETAPDFAT
jgi:hypothetical protein